MPFRSRRVPALLHIHPKSIFTFTALFPVAYVIACCCPFFTAGPDGVSGLHTIADLVSSSPRDRAFAIIVNLESLFIGICLLFREQFRHGKLSFCSKLSFAAVSLLMSLPADISVSISRGGHSALFIIAAMSFVIYFRVSDANVCIQSTAWLSQLTVFACSWVYVLLAFWFGNIKLLHNIGAAAGYITAAAILSTLQMAGKELPDDYELIITLGDSQKD